MDLNDFLKDIEKKAKSVVDGSYKFEELVTDKFLSENSKFENAEQFLENSPFDFSVENLVVEEISDVRLDEYISNNSDFKDFGDFLKSAANEAAKKKLIEAGFNVK